MSHKTQLTTTMTHLAFILQACAELGITVLKVSERPETEQGDLTCKVYNGQHVRHCHALLGEERWDYSLGLVRGEDGNFSLAGDWWGIRCEGQPGIEFLQRFGENYHLADHNPNVTPNKLMQRYAEKVTMGYAEYQAMTVTRIEQPNGDVTLELRGGSLPSGAWVEFVACKDGKTRVAGHGFDGQMCRQWTGPLMNALGVPESELCDLQTAHATNSVGQTVHVGA